MGRDYRLRNNNDVKHFLAGIIRMSAGLNYISDTVGTMDKINEECFN